MSTESAKLVIRRYLEFCNTGSESIAREVVSEAAAVQPPGSPQPLRGPQGYLAGLQVLRGGFPDIQWTAEEVVAEGDRVAVRFTMRGTHQGPFAGVPPSGKRIEVRGASFYRVADGKIVEEHAQPDMLALLQQIGGLPPRG